MHDDANRKSGGRGSWASYSGGIVGAAALVTGVLLLFVNSSVVLYLAGLPLVFVVPGMAIFAAIAPRMRLIDPGVLLGAVIISLLVALIGGFLLNVTGGLTRSHWIAWLVVVSVVAGIVSVVRVSLERPHTSKPVPVPCLSDNTNSDTPRTNILRTGVVGIIVAVLVTASLVISQVSTARTSEHFTQLWLVPRTPAAAVGDRAELGVRNLEGHPETVTVQLLHGNSPRVVNSWAVSVDNGSSWVTTVIRSPGISVRANLLFPPDMHRRIQHVTLNPPA